MHSYICAPRYSIRFGSEDIISARRVILLKATRRRREKDRLATLRPSFLPSLPPLPPARPYVTKAMSTAAMATLSTVNCIPTPCDLYNRGHNYGQERYIRRLRSQYIIVSVYLSMLLWPGKRCSCWQCRQSAAMNKLHTLHKLQLQTSTYSKSRSSVNVFNGRFKHPTHAESLGSNSNQVQVRG